VTESSTEKSSESEWNINDDQVASDSLSSKSGISSVQESHIDGFEAELAKVEAFRNSNGFP
jgi:hypothetical protein